MMAIFWAAPIQLMRRKYLRSEYTWSICNELLIKVSSHEAMFNDCWTGLGDNLMILLGYQLLNPDKSICLNQSKLKTLLNIPECKSMNLEANGCEFHHYNYVDVFRRLNKFWFFEFQDSDLSQLFSCYYKNKIRLVSRENVGKQCIHVRFGDWRLEPRISWDRRRVIDYQKLRYLYYKKGVNVVFTDDPDYLYNTTGIISVSKNPKNIMFDDGQSTIEEWSKLISCQFIYSFGQSKFSQTAISLNMAGIEC